jgi:hypothetical protein
MKLIAKAIFMATLALVSTFASAAEPIASRLGFEINGPVPEFVAEIRKAVALQAKINPGVGHELWMPLSAGSDANSASLIVYYGSAEQFAEATAREDASEEWAQFLGAYPNDKFPLVYSGMSRALIRSGVEIAKGGEVQVVTGFQVMGPMDGLVAQVQKGIEVQKALKTGAKLSLSVAYMSGEGVNRAAVLARYPSLAAWAKGQALILGSDQWQSFVAQFPDETYPIRFQGLMRAVAIY